MPEVEQIRVQVREILEGIVPEVGRELLDEGNLQDMGLDSVAMLLLITEIENRYSITLAVDDTPFDRFRSVSDIASYIAGALDGKQAAGCNV